MMEHRTKTQKQMQYEREQACADKGHVPKWDGKKGGYDRKGGWICIRCDRPV